MAIDKVTTPAVTDDSVTLAKMAPGTDGNIISYDASGNPVAVATGSAGQVLTSAGAGAPPTFATLTTGKILQHVTNTSGSGTSTTATGFTATSGLPTLNITPTSASSKIIVFANFGEMKVNTGHGYITIFSGTTDLGRNNYGMTGTTSTIFTPAGAGLITDIPNTTSQITYTVRVRGDTGTTVTLGGVGQTLTCLELGA